jgi:hypothetical protein
MRQENNRTIRSRHAAHRASKNSIGRLLGASSIFIPASPDASPRMVAPGAPGLKLRNAPVVTFHVTVGAFGQARPQPASLPFRNRRFLGVRKRHCCCRRNAEHQQKHRLSVKVQHRVLSCGLQELTTTSLASNLSNSSDCGEICLESCRVDRSNRIGVGEMLRASAWGHSRTLSPQNSWLRLPAASPCIASNPQTVARACLAPVAGEAQQHHEQVDKVEIK